MRVQVQEGDRLLRLRGHVNEALERLLPEAVDAPHPLSAAMRYALMSPGKRIRPVLALLSAHHLDCPLAIATPGACALELVHAASLVLDDLPCMDDAATRRGRPTVHKRYGEGIAVLTGVALLNKAFDVLANAPLPAETRLEMIALISRTVGENGLTSGQARDLAAPPAPTLGFLTQLHHQKTGVLFVCAVEIGALAAGAAPPAIEALRAFASELGLAFQARDDLDDEDDLARSRARGANKLALLNRDQLRGEVAERLSRAKLALRDREPRLAPIGAYVDLLFDRAAA